MLSMPSPRPLALAIACCLLAACAAKVPNAASTGPTGSAAGATHDAPSRETKDTGTALKIWSGDFDGVQAGNAASGNADVAQVLAREVPAGRSELAFAHLPSAIDLGGVQLLPQGPVQVLGQRFDLATATPAGVLERARGEHVVVRTSAGDSLKGTLVGAEGGSLTLDVDGQVRVVRDYADLALDRLPEGLATEPTLRFDIEAAQAGPQRFELRYPSGGLAWRAEYAVTLGDGDACTFSMDASALVANRSGASYADADVTLVAGDPRRAGAMAERNMAMQAAAAPMAFDAAKGRIATAGMAGEYHSYHLPGQTDLATGSIARVALLAPVHDAACTRRYTTRAGIGWWSPPQPLAQRVLGGDGDQQVVSTLEFENDKATGLDVALPAGRVRVSEHDGNLLGEAQIEHSPAGKKLELELGTAFDLRAERRQLDFQLDTAGHVMTESFAITLHNAGQYAATVRVVEALPRWSAWEIVASSVPWEKFDAQTVTFDVPVPAQGQAELTYTVRYRWPANVKPQG
jgi:hypothetical protein